MPARSQTSLNVRHQEMLRTRRISSALQSQDNSGWKGPQEVIKSNFLLKSGSVMRPEQVFQEVYPVRSCRPWWQLQCHLLDTISAVNSTQGHLPSLKETCHDSHLCPRVVPSGKTLTSLLLAWLGQEIPLFLHTWSILCEENLEIYWVRKLLAAQQRYFLHLPYISLFSATPGKFSVTWSQPSDQAQNRLKNPQFTSLGRGQRLGLGSWHYYNWRMYRCIQIDLWASKKFRIQNTGT